MRVLLNLTYEAQVTNFPQEVNLSQFYEIFINYIFSSNSFYTCLLDRFHPRTSLQSKKNQEFNYFNRPVRQA